MHPSQLKKKGYFVIMILVFGSVFLLMLTAFTGLLVSQKKASGTAVARERALHIAEAGLEYYRWYLAHNPGDITNGTTTPQPYIHRYTDPQTGEVGQFELTVEGAQSACGYIGAVDITSVGRLDSDPDKPRAIFGRYTRPNVAEYSSIYNAGVWIPGSSAIYGPWHSNSGVRMQGYNDSIMTSAVETWLCDSSYGCTPSRTVPGIYGAGDDSLWKYPVPAIDFAGLAVDLADIKARAGSAGRYFGVSGAKGYHVILKANNTFDVYRVNTTDTSLAFNAVDGWHTEDNILKLSPSSARTFIANYTIPENCSVIFFEDRVWLEGVVAQKVTIAAGNLITPSLDQSMIISNNITYATDDGSAGLLAIAEKNMLIPLNAPDDMVINAILIAQTGMYGRNKYCSGNCDQSRTGNETMNSSYSSYRMRDSLTVNGTKVSNLRTSFNYTNGCVGTCSGFREFTSTYDTDLIDDPPPLIPSTSEDYRFTIWEEIPVEE